MLSELVKILSNVDKSLSDTHMRVLSVLNSVESQLQLNWTVSAIAARSYLSEEQLNRVVKKIVGMSTRDYLISLRMKKAVDLLDNKDWSVKMIALRLGYADPNNFTHRFKKFYGVSPRQYRSLKDNNQSLRNVSIFGGQTIPTACVPFFNTYLIGY